MGPGGTDGRPGPRRRRRRSHLPDGRDAALQSQGLRLQKSLLRRLQPVGRRLLLGASGSPHRHGADRNAIGRRGHRGSPAHQGFGPEGRDDARQSAGRGLRQPDLRSILGGRDRPRPAAQLSHPDQPGRRRRPWPRAQAQQFHVDHPRQPGHHRDAHLKRCLRAPSQAQDRVRRGGRRMGAALHVPNGPRLRPSSLLANRRHDLEAAE